MVTIQEENCGSCAFYLSSHRVCRRYPPVPLMVGIKQGIALATQQEPLIVSYFAPMMPNGWCGEYKEGRNAAAQEN